MVPPYTSRETSPLPNQPYIRLKSEKKCNLRKLQPWTFFVVSKLCSIFSTIELENSSNRKYFFWRKWKNKFFNYYYDTLKIWPYLNPNSTMLIVHGWPPRSKSTFIFMHGSPKKKIKKHWFKKYSLLYTYFFYCSRFPLLAPLYATRSQIDHT